MKHGGKDKMGEYQCKLCDRKVSLNYPAHEAGYYCIMTDLTQPENSKWMCDDCIKLVAQFYLQNSTLY